MDELVERYRREHGLLFTVDTLEYLAKGGRIGRASAFAGALLNVKPILTIRDGEVVPLKRVRGTQKALAAFRSRCSVSTTSVGALECRDRPRRCARAAQGARELVEHERPQAQIGMETRSARWSGTHAGRVPIGFFWFDDPDS